MKALSTALVFGLALAVSPLAAPTVQAASGLVRIMVGDDGHGRPSGCPQQWCACYLNKALSEAGYAPNDSNRARDFADYGSKASAGQVGSIMVMSGHVGVVSGKCADGRIELVSGNHGNKVGVGCYAASKAIAWRAPTRGKGSFQVVASASKSTKPDKGSKGSKKGKGKGKGLQDFFASFKKD